MTPLVLTQHIVRSECHSLASWRETKICVQYLCAQSIKIAIGERPEKQPANQATNQPLPAANGFGLLVNLEKCKNNMFLIAATLRPGLEELPVVDSCPHASPNPLPLDL